MEIVLTTKEDLKNLIKEVLKDQNKIKPKLNTKQEEFLTKKQAASLLKVSLATIDNYRRQGKIKSYKIGANVRFKRSELIESFLNQ